MAKPSKLAANTDDSAVPDLDVTSDLVRVYISAEEVKKGGPLTCLITWAEREEFEARGDRPASTKVVLTLAGDPVRKLPLNKVNLGTLSDEWGVQAGLWIGKTFEAYFDKSVTDPNGKRTGGLRVRVPSSDEPPF
jgi:hypothetical protein